MSSVLSNERIQRLIEIFESYPFFTSKEMNFFKIFRSLPADTAAKECRKIMRRARARGRRLAQRLKDMQGVNHD